MKSYSRRHLCSHRSHVAVIAIITPVLLVSIMLAACHPLVNPADPRSVTYSGPPDTGGGTGGDDMDPEPILPLTEKWEMASDHGSGRLLPLEIAEDGSFVEPRDSGSFELWITFEESLADVDLDGVRLWIALAFVSGDTTILASSDFDVQEDLRRFTVPFGFIPGETKIRLRLTDSNGAILGERLMGVLVGDVDGNGVVQASNDNAAITAVEGFAVGTDNPDTIRADLDVDGLIEGSGMDDWNVVTTRAGTALPSTTPDFWD